PPQVPVCPPLLGHLDRGPGQVPRMPLELGFEFLEKGPCVGHRAGETGEDPSVLELPYLLSFGLDDGVPHGHLAVAPQCHAAAMPDRDDRRGVKSSHSIFLLAPIPRSAGDYPGANLGGGRFWCKDGPLAP